MSYQRPEPRLIIDEAAHTYRVNIEGSLNGSIIPSVTQLLWPIIPKSVSQYFTPESRDRGRRVHRMVQLDIEGRLDVAALDDELLSYYEGWMEFCAAARFRPMLVEQPVINSAFYYAGRLDLYGILDDKPALIDIKTGVVDMFVAGPQTAGYLMAASYEEMIPHTTRRYILDLKPGIGRLSKELTDKNDKAVFQACLNIHRHNERRKAA